VVCLFACLSACLLALLASLARSEVCALSRLWQLLVGGRRHVPADLDQHGLHGEVALPGCYAGELGKVDFAVARVDAGQVDFADEGHVGRGVGV
jgi:hypothetical protein